MNNGNINNDNIDNKIYARCVREHKFTFQEIYSAYLSCRKNKRNSHNALVFEINLESNLQELLITLNQKSYFPTRSVCFSVNDPKPREIFAADFRDRVVHHVLYNRLNKTFEKKFIYDSFACRKGKGTLNAVKRLQKFTRKIPKNKKPFYLQLDIHNFFMSINKNILFKILEKKINDKNTLWLTKTLIFHDPTQNYFQKGLTWQQAKVPEHKTLFNTGKDKGLPIGNLTSQFFANVYLNKLDQFVKHTLKIKHYVRYVDDFVILSDSKEKLFFYKKEISVFLETKLSLKLKPLTIIKPVSSGINFVGYIIKPAYLLARNRVVNNLHKKVQEFSKNNISSQEKFTCYDFENTEKFISCINSYLGYLKHSKHKKILNILKNKYIFLENYLIFLPNKVKDRFENRITDFREQHAFFKKQTKNSFVLLDVGKYYRVIEKDALLLKNVFHTSLNHTSFYPYINIPKYFSLKTFFLLPKNQVCLTKQLKHNKAYLRKPSKLFIKKVCFQEN